MCAGGTVNNCMDRYIPLPPVGSVIAWSFVVILCFPFFHAPLESRHLNPRSAGTVERAPNGDEHAKCYAQITNDWTYKCRVGSKWRRCVQFFYSRDCWFVWNGSLGFLFLFLPKRTSLSMPAGHAMYEPWSQTMLNDDQTISATKTTAFIQFKSKTEW